MKKGVGAVADAFGQFYLIINAPLIHSNCFNEAVWVVTVSSDGKGEELATDRVVED